MLLSILTPAVPSRLEQIGKLCRELARQIGALPVEHLVLLDNKRRTIGEKRDALLRLAHGDYVAFVDDDDWIRPDYISSLVSAVSGLKSSVPTSASEPTTPDSRLQTTDFPDVITFEQLSVIDGVPGQISFRLGNPNEPFRPAHVTRRNAWHVCAWRRTLAICSSFPASNYGEDWAYAAKLCAIPGLTTVHIPRILHEYHHSAETTEAPPPP
ncbi:MAG: glycosyltransferase family A protein [Chthoniobacteraceae bacterium]|nr:glycosyltransferase family A protein [Chthoniobacteraceae bacterium]